MKGGSVGERGKKRWEKGGTSPAIPVAGANDGMTRGCDDEMRLRRLPPPDLVVPSSRPRNN